MSPTRRSFIKAFIGAGAVAMLPETAFARTELELPRCFEDPNSEYALSLIPAAVNFLGGYLKPRTTEEFRLSLRKPDVQAGLREYVEWLKVAIQIAEEELR